MIRRRWIIENQCHSVLEVVSGADHNRIHRNHAPKNSETLLCVVLNILKTDKTLDGSLPGKRRHALLHSSHHERTPLAGLITLGPTRMALF